MKTLNEIVAKRTSLRRYADMPIPTDVMDELLDLTLRAPSAGNMLLYSIIKVEKQETKQLLSETCDNQPFIAQAPALLIFCADFRRWYDYYELSGVNHACEQRGVPLSTPQEGDLLLAVMDTMIASSYCSLLAEDFDLGTCYIGDIIENYETHQEVLNLPQWVAPIAMLTIGYYPDNYRRRTTTRFDKKFIVSNETYHRLSNEELTEMFAEKESGFKMKNKFDAENFGQFNYFRKTGTEFTEEMTRSVKKLIEEWTK